MINQIVHHFAPEYYVKEFSNSCGIVVNEEDYKAMVPAIQVHFPKTWISYHESPALNGKVVLKVWNEAPIGHHIVLAWPK
jgi:hypothetical protein